MIIADPRFKPIARNADLYLPLRPGTDLALLMGMLHVIMRDGLENHRSSRRTRPDSKTVKESVAPGTHKPPPTRPVCHRRLSKKRRTGLLKREHAMLFTRVDWNTNLRA